MRRALVLPASALLAALGACASDSERDGTLLKPTDFVDRSPGRIAERNQLSAVEIDGPPAPPPSSATGEAAVDAESGSDLLVGVDRSVASMDGAEGASLPADLAADDRTADKDAATAARDDSRAPTPPRDAADQPPAPRHVTKSTWVVDSLVGQINGRPIFADEFLDPIADRLRQLIDEYERPQARQAILTIVGQRFEEWVNNELIIAEAESLLSPEQKQGVLAFLKDFQEKQIVQRGGTPSSAESSLQETTGMTMEEFMRTTRNQALASDLLRKRVRPRATVSWRDIEREFKRAEAQLNPGATIELGRIVLLTEGDAAEVATVKDRLAQKVSFAQIATELGLENGGYWRPVALGPKGIDGLDFSDEIKAALKTMDVGDVSAPILQGQRTLWICLISRDDPPPTSIFDPTVQLEIRQGLQTQREREERERYIMSLRANWIAENIDEMRARLVEIALRRYWM